VTGDARAEKSERVLEAARKLDSVSQLCLNFKSSPDISRLAEVLGATAERLQDNFPYFHPLYAGQMLKPAHPVARLAYALAMWINPNNHALDAGVRLRDGKRGGRGDRRDVWLERFSGTSVWWRNHGESRSLMGWRTIASGKKILASEQAHYTHGRISSVLQLPFETVSCDARAGWTRMRLRNVSSGRRGNRCGDNGTTATGSVDSLPELLALGEKHRFRVHVDAAYGGYFVLTENLGEDASEPLHGLEKRIRS